MSSDEGRDATQSEQDDEREDGDEPAMPPGARAIAGTDTTVADEDKADGA